MLENLQYISILIEVIIAILGLMIVFKKKKNYGWGIFTTFLIYVFYDYIKLNNYSINQGMLSLLFFIATASMLLVVWSLFKNYFKK